MHSLRRQLARGAGRIRRYWHRDAEVIHPPVDVEYFGRPGRESRDRDYLLGVGALGRLQELRRSIIEIAAEAGRPLVIAGVGPGGGAACAPLAATVDVPVTFEVRPTRERLRELYWGAGRCCSRPTRTSA